MNTRHSIEGFSSAEHRLLSKVSPIEALQERVMEHLKDTSIDAAEQTLNEAPVSERRMILDNVARSLRQNKAWRKRRGIRSARILISSGTARSKNLNRLRLQRWKRNRKRFWTPDVVPGNLGKGQRHRSPLGSRDHNRSSALWIV